MKRRSDCSHVERCGMKEADSLRFQPWIKNQKGKAHANPTIQSLFQAKRKRTEVNEMKLNSSRESSFERLNQRARGKKKHDEDGRSEKKETAGVFNEEGERGLLSITRLHQQVTLRKKAT